MDMGKTWPVLELYDCLYMYYYTDIDDDDNCRQAQVQIQVPIDESHILKLKLRRKTSYLSGCLDSWIRLLRLGLVILYWYGQTDSFEV